MIPSFHYLKNLWASGKKWLITSAHVTHLFLLYRWLAWLFAGVILLLLDEPISSTNLGLFAITGGINVVGLLFIRKYLQHIMRQPLLMIPDILFGVGVIWVSHANPFLFMPYALSGLVLPTLLLGWRIGLIAAGSFIILSNAQLIISSETVFEAPWMLIFSLFIPMLFVMIWGYISLVLDDWQEHLYNSSDDFAAQLLHQEYQEPYAQAHNDPFTFINLQSTANTSDTNDTNDTRDTSDTNEYINRILTPPHVSAPKSTWRIMPSDEYLVAHQGEQDLRRVVYDLTPESDVAFSTALHRLTTDFSTHSGIPISIRTHGREVPIQPVQYITLFRLAQEALINIQQHAYAHSGLVSLSYASDSVQLTISDDGIGLLDGTYERSGVHALRLMRYRFAEIDGSLEVFDQQHGVIVCGTIPFP
jgi:hypothetical protein